jgi:threonine synthase
VFASPGGAAWAAYAARAGLRLLVGMPLGAPTITRAECVVAGADLRLVNTEGTPPEKYTFALQVEALLVHAHRNVCRENKSR